MLTVVAVDGLATVAPAAVRTAVDALTAPAAGIGVDALELGSPTVGMVGDAVTVVAGAAGAAKGFAETLAAVGTAVDGLAVVPEALGAVGDALTVATAASGAAIHVVAVVSPTVGIAGDALTVVAAAVRAGVGADEVADALLAVDAPDEVPPSVGTGVPAGAPARTGPVAPAVGAFAADEVPPGATPTGLEIFLAAAGPAESEDGALRGAAAADPKTLEVPLAPIETPTGREVAVVVFLDGEDAMPGF
jgi:hypothetical protein